MDYSYTERTKTKYNECCLSDTFFVNLDITQAHRNVPTMSKSLHHIPQSKYPIIRLHVIQDYICMYLYIDIKMQPLNISKLRNKKCISCLIFYCSDLNFVYFIKIIKDNICLRTLSSPGGSTGTSNNLEMGNSDSKQRFQQCLEQLSSSNNTMTASEAATLDQLCQEHVSSVQEIFALLPSKDIRNLKDAAPENLSKLCFKVTISQSVFLISKPKS